MRHRFRIAPFLLAIVLVAAAACSDDSDADGSWSGPDSAPSPEGCPDGTTDADGLCVAPGEQAEEIAQLVRDTLTDDDLGAVIIGVWSDGAPVVVGAVGEALPGVPATTDLHLPVGNLSASFLTTVFLQLVEEDVFALDDTLATWFPDLPSADAITLDQLAHGTTGYVHHPGTEEFVEDIYADPFRTFTPEELVAYAVPYGTSFEPGTDWQFSDTNLVVLGLVIEAETGRSVHDLIEERILGPEALDDTVSRTTGDVAPPVLHGFTPERGVWEEATHWTPTWVPWAGDMASNLADSRRWIEVVGSGEMLSEEMHDLQLAPTTVGLGPNTEDRFYAMGVGVTNGWVFTNPGLLGYRESIARNDEHDVTVVIFTTFTPDADTDARPDNVLFSEIGALLVPEQPPMLGP